MKTLKIVSALAVFAGFGLNQSLHAVDLVVNGGFETGNSNGWIVAGSQTFISGVSHTGDFSYLFGTYPDVGFLSQTLSTVVAGKYDISFWLTSHDTAGFGNVPNFFTASFGGTSLSNLVNSPTFNYTKFSFSGVTASTASTLLQFTFQSQPGYWAIDDISVTPSAANANASGVPDSGSTAALLGLALLGVSALARFPRKG